jgi:hypothetical protein
VIPRPHVHYVLSHSDIAVTSGRKPDELARSSTVSRQQDVALSWGSKFGNNWTPAACAKGVHLDPGRDRQAAGDVQGSPGTCVDIVGSVYRA